MSRGYTISISYDLSDGAYDTLLVLKGGDLPSDHEDRADLDVLQEIYASSDGFQDEDGNDVAVKASGFFRGGTSIEDLELLEANGYP